MTDMKEASQKSKLAFLIGLIGYIGGMLIVFVLFFISYGSISNLTQDLFLTLLLVSAFVGFSILFGLFIISEIYQYIVLKLIAPDQFEQATGETVQKWAERLFIFSPIATALLLFIVPINSVTWGGFNPLIPASSMVFLGMFPLIFGPIQTVISIVGFIGAILYGIYLYMQGNSLEIRTYKIACVFLIACNILGFIPFGHYFLARALKKT
ncbi:MAG: hypothetical protein ACTSRW_00025 [Candidatus Helarchaeota archaeon]